MGVAASAAISVGTTPTKLQATLTGPATTLIQNKHTTAIYVGGPDVSTTNGIEIAAGASLSFDGAGLYGIVAAATADVRVLEGK